MSKKENIIILKALKDYLKTLNIEIEYPYDSETGRFYSDKKYNNIIKEKETCKKVIALYNN